VDDVRRPFLEEFFQLLCHVRVVADSLVARRSPPGIECQAAQGNTSEHLIACGNGIAVAVARLSRHDLNFMA